MRIVSEARIRTYFLLILTMTIFAFFPTVSGWMADATTIIPPPDDAPQAVRPFLMECKKCSKVRVRGTGNVSIDSEGNPTEIVSERVRCRRCVVEFRTDTACQPVQFPVPGM